jgi:hypothetical protein
MCWFPRRQFTKTILGPAGPANLPATNEQVVMDWTPVDGIHATSIHAEVDALGGAGQIDQIAIESIIQPGQAGIVRTTMAVALTTGQAADVQDHGNAPSYCRVLATSTAGNIQARARLIVAIAG